MSSSPDGGVQAEASNITDGGPVSSSENDDMDKRPSSAVASTSTSNDPGAGTVLECPICLQPCIHPVELPCRHIFCFLCIKGVAMQGPHSRCAICRSSIPHNVLTHPRLKDVSQLYKNVKSASGFEWFYEARGGGWWQYDERSMAELDRAYETGATTCQLLIAGHLYEIDFVAMTQYRLNNRQLFRRIKRDLASAEKRGIAGIRLNASGGCTSTSNAPDNTTRARNPNGRTQNHSQHQQPNSNTGNVGGNINNVIVLADSDSDQDEGVDSDDPDYLEDEEDEMELCEEEELCEDVESEPSSAEEEELRDGARAPTRRSDRSTSSNNQSPPPITTSAIPSTTNSGRANSVSSPSSNCRRTRSACAATGNASRGSRRQSGCGQNTSGSRSGANSTTLATTRTHSSSAGGSSSSASASASPSPQQFVVDSTALRGLIRLSPAPTTSNVISTDDGNVTTNVSSVSPTLSTGSASSRASITTTTGITCLLIGPGVRITVDRDTTATGDNNENEDDIL